MILQKQLRCNKVTLFVVLDLSRMLQEKESVTAV